MKFLFSFLFEMSVILTAIEAVCGASIRLDQALVTQINQTGYTVPCIYLNKASNFLLELDFYLLQSISHPTQTKIAPSSHVQLSPLRSS